MILVLPYLSTEVKIITKVPVSASEWRSRSRQNRQISAEHQQQSIPDPPPLGIFGPLYKISKILNLSAIRTRKVGEVV